MKRRAAALCALAIVSGAIMAAPAQAAPPTGVPDAVVVARRLGDLRRGRPLGRQHEQEPVARRRARLDRLPRRRRPRGDPRLPPLQGGRDPHRRHDVESKNLACSGARTYTQPYSCGSNFKPGLDFYDDGAGHVGQAKALQQYAATRRVRLVVVLIGANNFGFASVVQTCVTNWLTSPTWWKNYCHDDSSVTQHVHDGLHRRSSARGDGRVRERPAGDGERGLRGDRLPARRADLLLPDPARRRLPLQGDRLHAPDDRRLRRLEPRRRLGQRHDGRHAQRARRKPAAAARTARPVHRRPQRARRPPAVREHRRPAGGDAASPNWTAPGAADRQRVGEPDPHGHDARARRTSSRRTCTRATGASSRCATACARSTR